MSTQIKGTTTTNNDILIENNIRLQPSIRENNNILAQFLDLTTVNSSIISESNNTHNLGSISKQWAHAYIRDLSVSYISVSGNIFIPDDTITESKLSLDLQAKVNVVNNGGIGPNSINSSHIQVGSILGSDISAGTITSSNIADGTILTQDICNNAITYDKLAFNSVGNTRIINGAVTHEKLSGNCIQSHNIVDGAILNEDICNNTITGSKIAFETITSSNILNGTILGTDISTGTIDISNLVTSAITYLQTTPPDSINSSHIQVGSILGSDISAGTIDISNLSSACIASLTGGGGSLTENSVNSSHIINGSILTEDICNNAITIEKLDSSLQTQLTGLSDKEGFYGTIGFINNTSNSSGIYNFVLKDNKTSPTTISAGIFTNPPTTIPIVVAENSASRLLRPYYEYNVEYLYNNTTLQEANISFTISGGTYRSANNKYYFTPNNNNINNGVLTLTSTLIKMGFYGTLTITNQTTAGSIQKNIQAKLAFNNVDLTNYITISGGAQTPLTISQANRLLVPNSILQLKTLFESGVSQVELANDSGFTISGATQNPLQQENTLDLLVDAGQIIDGSLNLTILVSTPKTGFWGTLRVHNINGVNGGRYLDYRWLVNGTPLNPVTRIYTNNQDPITISEINRLTDINVQLTLNVSFESNFSITDFSFNGADIVSAIQNQTILTANINNLTNGTINIYYTINNV